MRRPRKAKSFWWKSDGPNRPMSRIAACPAGGGGSEDRQARRHGARGARHEARGAGKRAEKRERMLNAKTRQREVIFPD